jgi:hypothetical protein
VKHLVYVLQISWAEGATVAVMGVEKATFQVPKEVYAAC